MILKKVRYVPGLISLIGLPILLLLFGPEDKVEQHVLKLYLPSDRMSVSDTEFTKGNVQKSIQNSKIVKICLWDKPEYYLDKSRITFVNNEKLKFVQDEMRRLQFTHDTTTFLKVELGEENFYGEFVWLLNQASIYGFKRYTFVDDNFYFLANDPPIDYSKIPPLEIDMSQSGIVPTYVSPTKTKWEIFKRHFQYQFDDIILMLKYNWLLSIGFLMLIFIPAAIQLLRRRKRAYL